MKTTHTPGPFKIRITGPATRHQIETEENFPVGMAYKPEDATLFCAAPELLEALETLLDCSPCQNGCDPSDMTCASNLARAAIAKAKGQS